MTPWQKLKCQLNGFELRDILIDIRRIIWNKHIKLWWYRLYIRKNEFHSSLSTDFEAIMVMNREEELAYREDLLRRRSIAHRRDLARDDAEFHS